MKIALCNGGLGNQVFQYIFSRYVEFVSGEECYLDDAAFFGKNVEHNGFEIPRVFPNAKPRLLSNLFTEDVWEYMLQQRANGTGICEQIRTLGEEIVMVAETLDYKFSGNVVRVPTNEFTPVLATSQGNIYFHGYWINRSWLKNEFYPVLREELTFTPLTEEHNRKYAEEIQNCNSVSLHIRRGDFVKLNRAASPAVYKDVVKYTEEKVKDAIYFVFSDDLDWCRTNMEDLGLDKISDRVHFVAGNIGTMNFRDMQLMSLCRNNILVGGSSFSFLAALLNANSDAMVINASGREV